VSRKRWRPGLQKRCARCEFFINVNRNGLIRRHASSYPFDKEHPGAGRVFICGTRCLGSGWPPLSQEKSILEEISQNKDEEALRLEFPL
jgi:hypothetical protein